MGNFKSAIAKKGLLALVEIYANIVNHFVTLRTNAIVIAIGISAHSWVWAFMGVGSALINIYKLNKNPLRSC